MDENIFAPICGMLSGMVLLICNHRRFELCIGQLPPSAGLISCGYELAKFVDASENAIKQGFPEHLGQVEILHRQAANIPAAAHDEENERLLEDEMEALALG